MQGWIAKLRSYALALVLAAAVQIGWTFLVAWTWESYRNIGADDLRPSYVSEEVAFTAAGEPLIARRSINYFPQYSIRHEYFTPGDRQPVQDPPLAFRASASLHDAGRYAPGNSVRVVEPRIDSYGWSESAGVSTDPHYPGGLPYFVVSNSDLTRGYFELFDHATRRRLGYIGARGFQERRPAGDEEFRCADVPEGLRGSSTALLSHPEYLNLVNSVRYDRWTGQESGRLLTPGPQGDPFERSQHLVVSGGRALLVDIAARTVQPICLEADVRGARLFARVDPEQPERLLPCIAVLTSSKVLLLHPQTDLRIEIPLPEGLRPGSFELSSLPDGRFTLEQPGSVDDLPPSGLASRRALNVWVLSPTAAATPNPQAQRRTIELALAYSGHVPDESVETPLITCATGSPAMIGLFQLGVIPFESHSPDKTPSQLIASTVRHAWWAMLLAVVVAAGLAWLAVRRQDRHRLPRDWGWVAFVFLFGLPGYCGYLLHRRWPLREPAPEPPRLGIEILRPAGVH